MLNPKGNGSNKRVKTFRSISQIGFENSLKFEERPFVKRYKIKPARGDPCFFEAKINRVSGELPVVLFPCEPLFLCSGYDVAILYQTRGGIMVKTENSENRGHKY